MRNTKKIVMFKCQITATNLYFLIETYSVVIFWIVQFVIWEINSTICDTIIYDMRYDNTIYVPTNNHEYVIGTVFDGLNMMS